MFSPWCWQGDIKAEGLLSSTALPEFSMLKTLEWVTPSWLDTGISLNTLQVISWKCQALRDLTLSLNNWSAFETSFVGQIKGYLACFVCTLLLGKITCFLRILLPCQSTRDQYVMSLQHDRLIIRALIIRALIMILTESKLIGHDQDIYIDWS